MFMARVPRSSLYHISCLVTQLSYSITPILLTMLVIIKIRIHQKCFNYMLIKYIQVSHTYV